MLDGSPNIEGSNLTFVSGFEKQKGRGENTSGGCDSGKVLAGLLLKKLMPPKWQPGLDECHVERGKKASTDTSVLLKWVRLRQLSALHVHLCLGVL